MGTRDQITRGTTAQCAGRRAARTGGTQQIGRGEGPDGGMTTTPSAPRARRHSLSRICEATALGLLLLGTAVVVAYLRVAGATHAPDPVDVELADLVAPLASSSEEVAQWNAIVSLGRRKDQVHQLAPRLAYLYVDRHDTSSRLAVVRALRGLGEGALPTLFNLLCYGTPEVQVAACSLLMQWDLRPEHLVYAPAELPAVWIDATPPLEHWLRWLLCWKLRAVQLARAAAGHAHPRVRTEGMYALQSLAEAEDESLLRRGTADPDPDVRMHAEHALRALQYRLRPQPDRVGHNLGAWARDGAEAVARLLDQWHDRSFAQPSRLDQILERLHANDDPYQGTAWIDLAALGPQGSAAVPAVRARLTLSEPGASPPDEYVERVFRHLFEQDERNGRAWTHLLELLTWREDDRALALLVLGEIGDPRTMPETDPSLPNPTPLERRAALYAWSHHGRNDPATISRLASLLDDPDASLARLAALALGKIGSRALPAVREWTARRPPDERAPGAIALWRMGPAAVDEVPLLKLLLRSDDPRTQVYAMRTLGALGVSASLAIPILLEAMRDPTGMPSDDEEVEVRRGLWSRWGRCEETVEDTFRTVPEEALAALCQLGKPGLRTVVGELDRHGTAMRRRIARALRAAGDRAISIVPDLIARWPRDPPPTRAEICAILGAMPAAADVSVPFLVTALDDEETPVRVAAVQALGELGPCATSAIDRLRALLEDEDLGVVEPAVEALVRIEVRPAARVTMLLDELARHAPEAQDLETRPFVARRGWPWHCAMRALSRLDAPDWPALIAALGDARPAVLRGVVEALFRADDDVWKPLEAACLDPTLAPAAREVLELRRALRDRLPCGLR